MTRLEDIPRDPMTIRWNSNGFLPSIGIHRRGVVYVQESSYALFWLFGIMLVIAVAIAFLPLDTVGILGVKLKYCFSLLFAWGGICSAAAFFIRNAVGQTILINPENHTLRIKKRHAQWTIAWKDIIGLQICRESPPEDPEMRGYQLNLAWQEPGGTVRRHCLFKHVLHRFVSTLGKRYESLFEFRLVDQTQDGQSWRS